MWIYTVHAYMCVNVMFTLLRMEVRTLDNIEPDSEHRILRGLIRGKYPVQIGVGCDPCQQQDLPLRGWGEIGEMHKKAILGVLVMYLYHFVLVSPWGSKSKIRQDRDQLQFFVISLLATGDWQTVCVELRRRSYVWWRPVVPLSRCAVARSWWQHVTCLAFNGSDLKIFEEPWLCWQNGVTGKLEGTQPDLETEHVSLHD